MAATDCIIHKATRQSGSEIETGRPAQRQAMYIPPVIVVVVAHRGRQ